MQNDHRVRVGDFIMALRRRWATHWHYQALKNKNTTKNKNKIKTKAKTKIGAELGTQTYAG